MKSKTAKLSLLLSAIAALGIYSPYQASAVTFTWNNNGAASGGLDASGTWTPTTLFWNGSTNVAIPTPPTVNGDVIALGSTTGGVTVTINNGGSLLNYATPSFNTGLNFNQSYTLAGTTAGDGVAVGNITVANAVTANISAVVRPGVGNGVTAVGVRNWNLGAGSTLNLSGGGSIQNIASSVAGTAIVNIGGASYDVGGTNAAGVYQQSGIQIGTSGGANANNLTVNVNSGATYNGGFNIVGNSNAGSVTTVNINGTHAGGGIAISLNSLNGATGNVLNYNSGSVLTGGPEFRVGNDGGSGTVNFNAGSTVTTTNKFVIARRGANGGGPGTQTVNGIVNVNGGVVTANQIEFASTGQTFNAGSNATLNVKGGTLNTTVGFAVAAAYANLATNVNLSGGTVGATTATGTWTSTMNVTLSNADGGVTFRASNADNSLARNMVLSGVLSGGGGFTKTGAGTLTLANASNVFGTINIVAGTVNLGSGGVDGNLILNTADVLVATGGVFNLNFTGTDTISVLYLNGVAQPIGVYGASTPGGFFTGAGFLNVTAVPEPSTWAILSVGLGVLAIARRRASLGKSSTRSQA